MMGTILLALGMLALGVLMLTRKPEEEPEEDIEYNKRCVDRMDYLEKHISLLQSDYTLGKITQEEYEAEKKAIQDELNAIGSTVRLEEKYTNPEIDEMGKLADNFFGSVRKDK